MIYTPSTKTLYVSVWSWYLSNEIIKLLCILNPKRFIYDCTLEFEPKGGFQKDCDFELLNTYVKSQSIEAHLLLGSLNSNTYIESKKPENFASNFNVEFYPLTFLLRAHTNSIANQYNITPTKLFYCLMNKPHVHRCILADSIIKHNLTVDGKFTWNILRKKINPYKFKYWKEKLIRDKNFNTVNSFALPESLYFESLFDLVAESTHDAIFYTEKTYKPILRGKPFIIFGSKGINLELIGLGFKIFNSVVDYSFDSIEDTEERAEALCQELKRLSTFNYQELAIKMQDAVQHNKKVALEYTVDGSKTPNSLLNNFVETVK